MERTLEKVIFASRWLLAPFYLGLIGAVIMLLIKFMQEFLHVLPHVLEMNENQTILMMLSFIDLSLAGNLLMIVIFSGYESFVSKIDTGDSEDRPDWLGKVDFSALKIKLIASIVAISGIHLLKAFMDLEKQSKEDLGWMVGIYMAFVVSGVLLAWMDRLHNQSHGGH
uniref:TIGR00645 family protein n=1 Tax=Paramagnetospirillum kuznetsovii TaxID=2053833 RepID=UPI00195F380A